MGGSGDLSNVLNSRYDPTVTPTLTIKARQNGRRSTRQSNVNSRTYTLSTKPITV